MSQPSAAPVIGGIVFKKGPSGWKQRWCIMKSQYFVYYKDEADQSSPQGYFDVTDSKCTPTANDGKSKWKFEVEDRTGRIWYLYVEMEKSRNQWVNAIRKIASAPTQLLPGQLTWEGEGGSAAKTKTNEVKGEANEVTSEDESNPNDEAASSFMKQLGKAMSGGDSGVLNLKKKKPKPAQNAGFVTRGSIYKEKTQTETNTFQTKQVVQLPTHSPYQVKELLSPAVRTSAPLGNSKLRLEEEENQRNQVALAKGMERKNKGDDEIDSDEDDLLPEEREKSSTVGCAQQ